MLPSRGAKRITLLLNKQEPCEAANRWAPPPDASQPPVRDVDIRPPSQGSPTPFRRRSMWRTGHEDSPSSKSDKKEDKKEEVKSQLESITGRMFALLNDYEDEDPQSKTYLNSLSEQVNQITNPELRGNMQHILKDYNDVCIERDELLFSLQDWFEQGHIDDMLEEVSDARFSFTGDPEALRKSLMDSKAASERLKVVKDKIKQGGSNDSQLIQEKDELERELLKSKTVFDALKRNKEGEDLHELETQVKRLVDTIDQQSTHIGTLKDELEQQRELVKHEELLKRRLAEESDLLGQEVKDVTQRVDEYHQKWIASEEQVKQLKRAATERRYSLQKPPGVGGQKPASPASQKAAAGGATVAVRQADPLQQQVEELKKRCATLEEENKMCKQQKEDLDKLVQELRDQLSSVEKKSTTLPKIEQVTPGRVVSASSGGGDTCDSSKRNKETVISARVEEDKKALVKLREMEEQLLAAKEDSEQAAAEVEKMSQDLQNLKEENAHLQQGVAMLEAEYNHLQRQYSLLQNKIQELEGSPTRQRSKATMYQVTPSTPIMEGEQPSPKVSGDGVTVELVDKEAGLTEEEAGVTEEEAGLTEEERGKVASLQLVVEMMQKLNAGAVEFEEADSTSLQYINKEMHRICADIQTFLEYSADLVSKEAKIVSEATGSLQMKFEEAGGKCQSPSPSSPGRAGPPEEMSKRGVVVEKPGSRGVTRAEEGSGQRQQQQLTVEQDLQARVLSMGQQAMDALRAGEQAFTHNITQQRKKLTSVVQAMAEHKKKQPKSWRFPVSAEEGLFLDTRAHHLEVNQKPSSLLAWHQRLRKLMARCRGERLTDPSVFLRVDQYGRMGTPAGFGSRAHTYASTVENFGRGSSFTPMVIRGTCTTNNHSGDSGVAAAVKAARAKSSLRQAPPLGGKRWRGLQRKNHFQLGMDEPIFSNYSGGVEAAGIAGRRQLGTSLPLIQEQNGRVDRTSHHSPVGLPPTAQDPDKRVYLDLVSHTISPFAQSSARGEEGGKKGQQQRPRRVKLPDIHTDVGT